MDGRILRAVKILAVALMGEGSIEDLTEETIAKALENLAENYERPADGQDGADGANVTAIELIVDGDGAVTGGTATLSDETEIEITVTVDTGG